MQQIHNQGKPLLLNKTSHFRIQRVSKQYSEACQRIFMHQHDKGAGRLSGLATMNIQLFAERYPRRMVFVDPVFDEIQN